ncbi:MAG: zf-HC2 domain-containing protein [Bryobacteraceae bacterium]
MEHTEAVNVQAVERYLLHELSGAELKAFEEHFFVCTQCAADLESSTLFIANARQVFREERAEAGSTAPALPWWTSLAESWRKPWAWAPSLAVCSLGVLALYQGFILMPELARKAQVGNEARSLPTFPLTGVSRGEARAIVVPRETPFFGVTFDITPGPSFPAYHCVLQNSAGRVQFAVAVPPPPPGQPVTILVPARGLQPGIYKLVLFGASATGGENTKISDYEFRLDLK